METVVQLFRKTPDAHIDLKIDMDELDLTASEAKATYQEIKDYILNKHGVKVSSLYIAQTKQKHGIIERDCYNKPKNEQKKALHCAPDKEKLIEEDDIVFLQQLKSAHWYKLKSSCKMIVQSNYGRIFL